MTIKLFILYLLKFSDDEIVLTNAELGLIKEKIRESLGIEEGQVRNDGFTIFPLKNGEITERIKGELAKEGPAGEQRLEQNQSISLRSAELGYYHHRVILSFLLSSFHELAEIRDIREAVTKISDEIISEHIIMKINDLVKENRINGKGRVDSIYKYPIIIREKVPKRAINLTVPFSDQTTTMSFDIVEPALFHPFENHHLIRISIPSMIISTQKTVNKHLMRDIINYIYQFCLYQEKLLEGNEKAPNFNFENKINEELLVKLWEQIMATMGGRTYDLYIAKMTHATYLLSLFAVVLAIISLLISLWS